MIGVPIAVNEPFAEILFTPTSITIRWINVSEPDAGQIITVHSFEKVTGNFPPVARLLPNRDGIPKPFDGVPTIALTPEHLDKFTRGAKRAAEKNSDARFTFQSGARPSRPGPVLIEFASFRGLLQPKMLP